MTPERTYEPRLGMMIGVQRSPKTFGRFGDGELGAHENGRYSLAHTSHPDKYVFRI